MDDKDQFEIDAPGIHGVTLSLSMFEDGIPFLDGAFLAIGNEEIPIEEYDLSGSSSGIAETTTFADDVTETSTNINMLSEHETIEEHHIFFSVVIIVLIVTGIIANLSGYIVTAANHEKDRHYHNFLHLFMSNIYILLPLPFTVAARLKGEWTFGDKSYKMLSVVFSSANTSCTYHLLYLAFIRCREMREKKFRPTKGWRKVVCYFIWLAAVALSWPTAVYDDVLWDVIKPGDISRSFGGTLFIKVDTIISFVVPGFSMAALFLFACIETTRPEQNYDRKNFRDLWNDVTEIGCIFILSFVCWLPYRAWEVISLQYRVVNGCEIIPSLVLCFGMTFSTIMPMLHFAFLCTKTKKRIDSTSSEDGENLNPDTKTTSLDGK